jgi:2-C-methyl-D-erythritol 2,4-cyclodiphosphate synthase
VAEPRFGLGFDSHRSDPSRPLVLGGVRFEGPGLAGHSDGDVVCHAVADALLGAAALGDIGEHFPDTDPAVAGITGPELLRRTVALIADHGLAAVSCDLIVLAERPALGPRRDEIRAALAEVLSVELDRVSVKATRPEGLGLTGDGIGCLALAVLA